MNVINNMTAMTVNVPVIFFLIFINVLYINVEKEDKEREKKKKKREKKVCLYTHFCQHQRLYHFLF